MKIVIIFLILTIILVNSKPTNVTYLEQITKSISNETIPPKDTFEINRSRQYYSKLGKTISLIFSPILLVIGGIGNPLCIAVLIRKRQSNPTIVYLCLLAAIDFLVLYTGLLRKFLKESMNIDMRGFSSINCKLHIFLTYTFMQISSYILVAVTVNRFTIMFNRTIFCKQKRQQPNNSKQSIKSVIWIFSSIVFIVSLLNLHFLIYYELIGSEDKQRRNQEDCSINKKNHEYYFKFRDQIFGQIHLHLFIVFPCFILFIMNILIIRKLMQSKITLNSKPNKQTRKKEKKRTALSFMLVAVCLWFVVLKTPASLYLNFPPTEMDKPHFQFIFSLVMLINYTNHAVNLILYIVISSSFRKEFKEFFVSIKNKIPFWRPNTDKLSKNSCVSYEATLRPSKKVTLKAQDL